MWGYDFDMVLVCFWYGFGYGLDLANMVLNMILRWFDTVLIRFWYYFLKVPVGWFEKRKQDKSRGRLLVDFSKVFGFWYDFDMVLLRFWCDFEAMLIWFWYVFKFCSQFWPISKSFLKPCQNHDCITRPQTNHNNTSHLNRWKTSILELEASDVITLGHSRWKNTRVTLILAVY